MFLEVTIVGKNESTLLAIRNIHCIDHEEEKCFVTDDTGFMYEVKEPYSEIRHRLDSVVL